MRREPITLIIIVALAALASACGGGTTESAAVPTTSTVVAATTPPTTLPAATTPPTTTLPATTTTPPTTLPATTTTPPTLPPTTTTPPTTTLPPTTTAPPTLPPNTTAPPTTTTTAFAALPTTCPPDEPLTQGLSEQVIEVEGRQREYSLYVPASHDPSQQTPVVFVLHGRGGSRNVGWWGFQPLADRDGWLLVYPQGLAPVSDNPFTGGLVQEVPQWNFKIMGFDIDSAYSDMEFFSVIRNDLAQRTCVDAGRVFATGNSAGGYMSSEVACRLAPEFAAVAPVGGLLPPSRCNNDVPTPINVFYGKLDETNPYDGAVWRSGVEKSMAMWADRNGCGGYSSSTIGATTMTEWDCPAGSETVLYAAGDAGHTWPGLEDIVDANGNVIHDWNSPINRDFSATEVIWEFLGRQSRS